MNIVKAADLLKGAPDAALERYLSNPTGEFPEYLVAAEKTRRDELRKKYSAENAGKPDKTSIIEEMIQKAGLGPQPQQQPPQMPPQMPPEAMGIGSVPPPPGMQMTPPPMMAAAQMPPQQMYDGGVVALAVGGETNPFAVNQNLITQQDIPTVGDLGSYVGQAQQFLGPSGAAGFQDYLRQQQEDLNKKRGNYLSDFLINAGLGMAASKRLDPLGAAAEGALQGFTLHQKARQQDDEAEKNLREAQFKFQQAERAERAGVLGVSQKLYDSAVSQRNQAIDNNRAAEQLRLTGQKYSEDAKLQAKQLGISEKELAIRASNAASQSALAKAQMGLYETRADLYKKQAENVGKPKPPSIKEITEARGTIMMSAPYREMRKRLMAQAGKDPVKMSIVESQLAQWVDSQIPKSSGVYLGPTDSE